MLRAALLIDGIGCAASALVVLFWTRLWNEIAELPHGWRIPFGIVLLFFGLIVTWLGRHAMPSALEFRTAALLNIGWVLACAVMATRVDSTAGKVTLALVAVLDAVMSAVQWASSSRVPVSLAQASSGGGARIR